MSIKENVEQVRARIARAAAAAGRRPEEITLVAVTKTVPEERIAEAVAAGITDLGENRVQEALPKVAAFPAVTWHFLGHLQTNKVKEVVGKFALIHSVDSEHLLSELGKRSTELGAQTKILIEVNVSGEASKYGVAPDGLIPLLQVAGGFGNISVEGLMTVAPIVPDPEQARPHFAALRELGEKIDNLHLPNVKMKYLSMGMTDDFEAAIQEGANLVRIGRAIFGKRS